MRTIPTKARNGTPLNYNVMLFIYSTTLKFRNLWMDNMVIY